MWLIWAITRVYGLFAIRHVFPYNRTFPSSGDIDLYGAWAHLLWQGLVPYRDYNLTPPGILPIILLPSPSPSVYTAEFIAIAFIVDALVFHAVYRSGRHLGAATWLVGALFLGPIFWCRLDIFVASALVAGLLCLESRRYSWAAVWMTWAALIKLWPFVLVIVLLRVIPRDKWRSYLTSAGIVTSLFVLPFADLGGTRGLWRAVQSQAVRGVEIESLFAIPLYILRSAGHKIPIIVSAAIQFSGSDGDLVANLSTLAFAAAMLLCLAKAYRNRSPQLDAAGWILLIAVAVVVTSKVLSPQFLVWVLAAVALRVDRSPRKASLLVCTGLLLLMTQAQFPFGFLQLVYVTRWALPLSVVHGVVLMAFTIVTARDALSGSSARPVAIGASANLA